MSVGEEVCACVCWLVIQCADFCKPWRPDPQLLSGSVTWGVSVELAYKEVTREVTMDMDSVIRIKLLSGAALAPSRQPIPGPLQAVLEPSACQQRVCPGQPSAARRRRRHLFMGATFSARGKLSLQQRQALPCQVPNYSSSCNQRPWGQWGKALFTARGEGKDMESNRKGCKTLGLRRKMWE